MSALKRGAGSLWIAGLCLAIAGLLVQAPQVVLAAGSEGAVQSEPSVPIYLSELANGDEIGEALTEFISSELKLSEEEASELDTTRMMEVSLGGLPPGYTREFVSFVYSEEEGIELLLLAADGKAAKITLLGRASASGEGEALFVNTAKLEVWYKESSLIVWSQAPFRAFESNAELEWNGKTLQVVSHDYGDPTQEYYDRKRELIEKKDMKGLIAQSAEGWVEYPGFYSDYYELAGPALLLSYDKALASYKKDVKTAIQYMEYGLEQYGDTYLIEYAGGKVTKTDIVGEPDAFYPPSVSFDKFVAILNDYAYFLSLAGRNKEAKPILTNMITLVPGRVVAYLNLADVEWALGQKAAAKTHYKHYLKLLGSKAAKVAPKRVQERINAK